MKKLGKVIQNKFAQMKGETSLKTILITISFLVLAIIMINSVISNIQLQYQKSQLSSQVFELTNQNKNLEQKIEQASTNGYIEEQAREKLGMVKSNEVPIKIVETKDDFVKENTLKPGDKMGIYLNDWYSEIGKWFENMKK